MGIQPIFEKQASDYTGGGINAKNSDFIDALMATQILAKCDGDVSPHKKYAEDPLAISPYKKYAEDPLGMKRFGDSPNLEGLFDRLYAGVNGHEPSMTHYTDTKLGSSPRKDAILLGWPPITQKSESYIGMNQGWPNIKQESRGMGDVIEASWPKFPTPQKYEAGVEWGLIGVDRVVLHADGVGYWKPPKIQAGGLQEI